MDVTQLIDDKNRWILKLRTEEECPKNMDGTKENVDKDKP